MSLADMQDPKNTSKPIMRCGECDRETDHYNVFLNPQNEEHVVCWECTLRAEKGFFASRGFSRDSRRGVIPR
jgi:hypothetical protein